MLYPSGQSFEAEVHIHRARKTIIENIKISAKDSLGYSELKKHKPRLDDVQNY
jgi:hypothetical protein